MISLTVPSSFRCSNTNLFASTPAGSGSVTVTGTVSSPDTPLRLMPSGTSLWYLVSPLYTSSLTSVIFSVMLVLPSAAFSTAPVTPTLSASIFPEVTSFTTLTPESFSTASTRSLVAGVVCIPTLRVLASISASPFFNASAISFFSSSVFWLQSSFRLSEVT